MTAPTTECMDLLIVHFFERAVASQDVRNLANHEAQVAEVERDVLETQYRCAGLQVVLDRILCDREKRQRHASLDASLQTEKFEVQVHRRLELRLLRPDGS